MPNGLDKDALQSLDLVLCLCEEQRVFDIVAECKAMSQNDIHASVEENIHRGRTGTCCKCWSV